MQEIAKRKPNQTPPQFIARIAKSTEEINKTLKLRSKVFKETFGANFDKAQGGLDQDRFDSICRHLYVMETKTLDTVSTARLLGEEQAKSIGSFYCESEFEVDGLYNLPDKVIEIGRVCIRAEYRNSKAILSLWQALSAVLTTTDKDTRFLVGCCSISMNDGGVQAEAIMRQLRPKYLDQSLLKVRPLEPLPKVDLPPNVVTSVPPLLKYYLKLGAKICGEAHWDKDWSVADVFIIMDIQELTKKWPQYKKHFNYQGRFG